MIDDKSLKKVVIWEYDSEGDLADIHRLPGRPEDADPVAGPNLKLKEGQFYSVSRSPDQRVVDDIIRFYHKKYKYVLIERGWIVKVDQNEEEKPKENAPAAERKEPCPRCAEIANRKARAVFWRMFREKAEEREREFRENVLRASLEFGRPPKVPEIPRIKMNPDPVDVEGQADEEADEACEACHPPRDEGVPRLPERFFKPANDEAMMDYFERYFRKLLAEILSRLYSLVSLHL
jgi:hypothetical protein